MIHIAQSGKNHGAFVDGPLCVVKADWKQYNMPI